jgi:hypothetical protein
LGACFRMVGCRGKAGHEGMSLQIVVIPLKKRLCLFNWLKIMILCEC